MKKTKKSEEERLLDIAKQLSVHSNKVKALVNGLEAAQINNKAFSLGETFYTTKSQAMTKAINDLLETYEALRREVREVAQI
jgi:Zn-dependent M16 (insulinase) family peptidase